MTLPLFKRHSTTEYPLFHLTQYTRQPQKASTELKLPCGPSPEKNPRKEYEEVYLNLVKADLVNTKIKITPTTIARR